MQYVNLSDIDGYNLMMWLYYMGTNNMLTGLNPSAGQNTLKNQLVMAYQTNYIYSLRNGMEIQQQSSRFNKCICPASLLHPLIKDGIS